MALYLCRWENGDFSVIQANNKDHAIERLDEVANAEGLPLYAITEFMAHFRLTDDGTVELEGFGELFGDHILERVHPLLGKLQISPYDASPKDKPLIIDAVHAERTRLEKGPVPEPSTELGKHIKAQTDMPTSLIDKHVQRAGRQVLQKMKPKGKPN